MTNPQDNNSTPDLKHWLRLLRLILIAFAVVLAGVAVCGLSIYATNRAEGAMQATVTPIPCPGPGSRIVVLVGNKNLRPRPGGPSGAGTPANPAAPTLISTQSGELVIDRAPEANYYHISDGDTVGWIVGGGLQIICVSVTPTVAPSATRTPTSGGLAATSTRTATAGPTNTARPVVTPTRLANQILYCSEPPTITPIEVGVWRVVCNYR